ncbi:LysM peptidoglycan-binding domain-containing protein [Chengkuizengella sp. SCS-71B]|uniref:LysM peptidoglycan-binding domain-containing protein n=1 Tax=Chengkuizengella sp. SCS-71B TaxID=3115290 RepID=UPI0032C21D36
MQFWLTFNNGAEKLQLPVNPDRIEATSGHQYSDVQVSQFGEYTVIGDKQLREFQISSFFPRDYHSVYCEYETLPDPWLTVKRIRSWQQSGEPVRFIVTEGLGETDKINVLVTIRSFQYEEKAGSPGDVYYNMALKEYRFLNFKKVEDEPTLQEARPGSKNSVSNYIVKSGDTLWKIAQSTLGNGSLWTNIHNANIDVIGPNPNQIIPGQKLVIPS